MTSPSTLDVFKTLYSHDEMRSFNEKDVIEQVLSSSNIDYLTKLIIERADPLRNGSSLKIVDQLKSDIQKLLQSWANLGKFEKDTISFEGKRLLVRTISPTILLDHYNTEFVKAFAESLLPMSNVTKVTSVVNPNGLYAQQDRIVKINSKPVPFYERALYRRLHDTKLDQRIDETEMPFYKMDTNPRLTDQERKKRNVDTSKKESYIDRVGLSYRMNPKK